MDGEEKRKEKIMKLYNVEIFEYATGKTEAVIGKNMTERAADKRQMTGLMRVNEDFGVRVVETKEGE
jgi:hypothetical protein